MISRWNYIAVTTVMLITFVLFQFTNVMLERWNHYEENPYIKDVKELSGEQDAYTPEKENPFDAFRNEIVYIGDDKEKLGEVVHTWAVYAKRNIRSFDSLMQYQTSSDKPQQAVPEMIAVNAKYVDWEQTEEACAFFLKCAREGSAVVFCSLPEAAVIRESTALRELLGIARVAEAETKVDGIYLQGGFLLGGEAVYRTKDAAENKKRQDMQLVLPWYILTEDTNLYMRGICADETIEEKDSPAVIWEHETDGASVYAVNGDYMEDAAGLGLLSAMWSKSRDYDIYPVVNGQNLVISNYPGFSDENQEKMKQCYGRSAAELFRDEVWPSLIGIYQRNALGLSCMLAPQSDYEDDSLPDPKLLIYYMKLLSEERAEAGLSGVCVSDTSVSQKLEKDCQLMEEALPTYQFTSFYAGDLGKEDVEAALEQEILAAVRTIVTDYNGESEVIGYQNENITRQSVLADGSVQTYREDFRVRGVETALGYTAVLADLNDVVYAEGEEDVLTEFISSLSWNVQSGFKGFQEFEGTGVSECDERIRSFLALDYTQNRIGNTVYLEWKGSVEKAWFLFRCGGNETVSSIQGGTFRQLEEDVYLVEAQSGKVDILLRAKWRLGN